MKKALFFFSIALNLVFLVFNGFLLSTAPDSSNLHINQWSQSPAGYTYLSDYFQGLDSSNAMTGFNYRAFLMENSFIEPFDLDRQLNDLDSTVAMHDTIVENVVFNALAFESFNACKDSVQLSNPDFVFKKLKWAENLQNNSLMSMKNGLLFSRISDFWLQKISDELQKEVSNNYNKKYSFDYIYLTSRLGENKYFSGVKNSDSEKVIQNMFEGKYAYIWSRFTTKSIVFQTVVFLGLASCLLIFVIGIISIFRAIKKKKKTVEL
jgi:hypothetical protein